MGKSKEEKEMKRYMSVKQYCAESGFPRNLMYRLCRSYMSRKFSTRTSDAYNAHIIIYVPEFEKLWKEGAFRNVIE